MARDTNLEIWENPTQSLVGLLKLDHRGVQIDVLVSPGRKVHLTPEEREINEGMYSDDQYNVFRNGLLRPVKLVADPEVEVTLTANAKSDKELLELMKKSGPALTKALAEMDGPVAVRRLLSLAEEHDASVKQVQLIKDRLDELEPERKQIQVNTTVPTGQ